MENNLYLFEVTGQFCINKDLKVERAFDGTPCGFVLPDGRTVRLAVALEVESTDGNNYEYITAEKAMSELGFEGLDYDKTDFIPTRGEENDDYEG